MPVYIKLLLMRISKKETDNCFYNIYKEVWSKEGALFYQDFLISDVIFSLRNIKWCKNLTKRFLEETYNVAKHSSTSPINKLW